MTKYVGIADLGDEMTATVGIDDIDAYGWQGNFESGDGHHTLAVGPVRVVLRDGARGEVGRRDARPRHVRRPALLGRAPLQGRRPDELTGPSPTAERSGRLPDRFCSDGIVRSL